MIQQIKNTNVVFKNFEEIPVTLIMNVHKTVSIRCVV